MREIHHIMDNVMEERAALYSRIARECGAPRVLDGGFRARMTREVANMTWDRIREQTSRKGRKGNTLPNFQALCALAAKKVAARFSKMLMIERELTTAGTSN